MHGNYRHKCPEPLWIIKIKAIKDQNDTFLSNEDNILERYHFITWQLFPRHMQHFNLKLACDRDYPAIIGKRLDPLHFFGALTSFHSFLFRQMNSNTIIATKVLIPAKTLQTGRAAGCDEIRPEMPNILNREFIGWFMCVKWPGVVENSQKISKLGWS